MKRGLALICLTLSGVAGLVGGWHGNAYAAGKGHVATSAVGLCAREGYAQTIGTDGSTTTSFPNTGQCLSYAVHGGTLVTLTAAQPCLNGNYANLITSNSTASFAGNGALGFGDEATCLLYVGQGGVPVIPPSITAVCGPTYWTPIGSFPTYYLKTTGLAPGTLVYAVDPNATSSGLPAGRSLGIYSVLPSGFVGAIGQTAPSEFGGMAEYSAVSAFGMRVSLLTAPYGANGCF